MRRFEILSDEERIQCYEGLSRKALLAYGLCGDLDYVGQGTNTVLRVRSEGGSLAVRIGPPGSDLAALLRELLWLAALGRDTPLDIPEPILTLHGEIFRSVSMEGVPGIRACAVLRWIDGERREADLTTAEVTAMGALVGALHRHAETFRWPEEIAPTYEAPAGRTLVACDALRPTLASPADRALLCDAAAFIAEATAGLGTERNAVGAVHGDLRLRRFRLCGTAAGIFGFHRCRPGTYLDDLSLLWEALDGRTATPDLRRALWDGYLSVRELPAHCEGPFQAFAALRALESAAGALAAPRSEGFKKSEIAESVTANVRRMLATLLKSSPG